MFTTGGQLYTFPCYTSNNNKHTHMYIMLSSEQAYKVGTINFCIFQVKLPPKEGIVTCQGHRARRWQNPCLNIVSLPSSVLITMPPKGVSKRLKNIANYIQINQVLLPLLLKFFFGFNHSSPFLLPLPPSRSMLCLITLDRYNGPQQKLTSCFLDFLSYSKWQS